MHYCDYNATFPLADAVRSEFAKGNFFANSSSQHSAGKKTAQALKQVEEYLFNFFHIDSNLYKIIFHSGATEGANHFFKMCRSLPADSTCLMHSPIDHSCFRTPAKEMSKEGRQVLEYKIDQRGFVDLAVLENSLEQLSKTGKKVFLNTTWIHNELGIIEDLEKWAKLKAKYNFFWHIDATQCVFKIQNYNKLISGPDMWTFSGHKFGSLMGVGWSFINSNTFGSLLKPLIVGGEQQNGLRAGTVNVEGIFSMKWALEDLSKKFNFDSCMNKLLKIKTAIDEKFQHGERGTIFFSDPKHQACNTLSLAIKDITSDVSLPAFDLAGIQLGTGAACASGGIKPQVTLNKIGHQELANQYLRFSMNPFITDEEVDSIINIFNKVIKNFYP